MALAALLFAVMAVSAKCAMRSGLSGPEVAFLRFCMGLLSAVIPLGLGVRLRPQNYSALFLRGFLGGIAVLAYFAAINHLPVGIATMLNSSSPIFVAVFSRLFLGEQLSGRTILALVVSLAGVTMVVLGSTPSDSGYLHVSLFWALVGLSSAVLSGGAVTTVRSMRNTEGSWEIFLTFCLIGAAMAAVPTATYWVTPSWTGAGWLLVTGISSVGAQVLMTYALRDVVAAKAGLILQLTPIATFSLGVGFLGDRPAVLGIVGAVVTVFGVTWSMLVRGRS